MRRSVTSTRLMTRVGGAERKRMSRLAAAVPRGLIGYYGRVQGMPRHKAETVALAWRKAMARSGWRGWRGARLQVYAPEAAGGLGEGHPYAWAAEALIDQVDRALSGGPDEPARVAMEAAIAAAAVRLGYVPSEDASTPLD